MFAAIKGLGGTKRTHVIGQSVKAPRSSAAAGEARPGRWRAQRALRAALHRHAGAGHAGNQRSWAWKLSVMVRWKTDSKPT
jgi:hypothetical protein